MTTITTRAGKGAPLTHAELDANFTALNAGKAEFSTGTFTPVIVGTTTAGVGTYSSQVGRYTMIGNRVFFSIALIWSAHTGTGSTRISGLPFVANTLSWSPCAAYANTLTLTGQLLLIVAGGTSQIFVRQLISGVASEIAIDTAATLYASGHYEV